MSTLLKKVQKKLTRYANVLSEALEVNVKILDCKFNIIAGSKAYKVSIDQNVEDENNLYRKVIASKQLEIVNEPKKDDICINCPKHDACVNKFEVCSPIILNDEIIGMIVLVCVSEKQEEKMLANLKSYTSLLKYVSDNIKEMVSENMEQEKNTELVSLFSIITEEIDKAVVILDKNFCISYSNKKANDIFEIYDTCSYKMNIDHTGNYLMEFKEYSVIVNGKKYLLVGNISNIDFEEKYKYMFMFNDSSVIKNNINRIMDINKDVAFDSILGTSKEIITIKKNILNIAGSTSSVLISGEVGSGKETLARAIHKESYRRNKPFIIVDCKELNVEFLEEELFGKSNEVEHEKGKLELANGGTMFFNKIDEMPLHLQEKLLRVIEDKEIATNGENSPIQTDIRFIFGTNNNIEHLVKSGSFIEELYYTINVIPIRINSLRERVEDIKVITYSFAMRFSKLFSKKFIGIDEDAWEYLLKYDWPGNIAELKNNVEFMINIMNSDGIINKEIIPQKIIEEVEKNKNKNYAHILNLKQIEKQTIKNALSIYGFSTEGKKMAATKLGIGIATLYRKIDEYKIMKI